MTPAPQIGLSAAAVAGFPAAVPSVTPTVGLASPVDNPEQLKALQHQMVLQQQLVQQQLLRYVLFITVSLLDCSHHRDNSVIHVFCVCVFC